MKRNFSRREFLQTSAIGAAVAGATITMGRIIYKSSATVLPNPYQVLPYKKSPLPSLEDKPIFFDVHQFNTVFSLAALIVPTDDTPGAAEAGVAGYIDRLVAGSQIKQKRYTRGLEWIDKVADGQYGNNFIDLPVKEQIQLLTAIDETETKIYRQASDYFDRVNRKIDELWSDAFGLGNSEGFFELIRNDVFYGYYSNPISWQVIGYYGPPQPVGYPDYAKEPSSEKYINTVRPVTSKTCQNCHIDQLEKKDHKDRSNCTECHDPHPFFKGGF